MKKPERITCQIVTYNSATTIRACLKSISQLSTSAFEVLCVIVDNASTDQTREIIEEERHLFKGTLEVSYEEFNLGFSGGHNKAISMSRSLGASYITLINPDLSLREDALIHMRNAFKSGYKIGAVCPKLYRTDEAFSQFEPESASIDSSGMVFESSFRHFDRGSGTSAFINKQKRFSHPEYVSGASGACVMFSCECIDTLTFPPGINPDVPPERKEFLDEDFFAYREDAELSLRMKWFGWRTRYEPAAEGYHVRRVLPERRGSLPEKINALGVQNRFLMQIQVLPVLGFLLLCPMILLRNLIVIGACLIREQSSLKAFSTVIKLFPRTLKKRRWILKNKKSSLLSWLSLFYRGESADSALSLREDIFSKDIPLPSLHVSIVSYNQSDDIFKNLPFLLESLRKNFGEVPSWKITITNNSPEDTLFTDLKDQFGKESNILFHIPGENLGFAKANNLAFESSTADIYLVLNPDIKMNPEALGKILKIITLYSNIGAISPTLIDEASNKVQFKYLAKRLPRLGSLIHNLFFLDTLLPSNPFVQYETAQDDPILKELLDREENTLYEIEQAAGACLFIPSAHWKALGGFDPIYHPAWFEDVDLAKKIKDAGLVSAIHTGAKVVHEGGTSERSIGRARLLKYFYKNMAHYWKIHNQSKLPSPLIGALIHTLIFICFSTRRTASYLRSRVSGNSTDSLHKVWEDFRYFFL